MFLVVGDATLRMVVGTSDVMAQLWSDAVAEVVHLLEVLDSQAFETLTAVLGAFALINLVRPAGAVRSGEVTLEYRRVVITALALNADGQVVARPFHQCERVAGLELTDIAAAGRSALRAAV